MLNDYFLFFFNDTATTEIYTLSLHDALPILPERECDMLHADPSAFAPRRAWCRAGGTLASCPTRLCRSEEHTSELQSRQYLVCRLLLEKKKKNTNSLFLQAKNSTCKCHG